MDFTFHMPVQVFSGEGCVKREGARLRGLGRRCLIITGARAAQESGALEDMPRKCVTIGMKEILGARKLRLGVFRDWHRAVCRRAAYGEVTAAFPATLAQNHPDALLYVNANAAQTAY